MHGQSWNNPILPKFIVFEGIDGSGTTTQAHRLAAFLCERGFVAEYTCEPTDYATGKALRALLSGAEPYHPRTMSMLFAADRHEHLERVQVGIRARLADGAVVVSDRYLFSSLAYQSLEDDPHEVARLNGAFPLPEHLIYLRVDAPTAVARLAQRIAKDNFERLDFQYRVAESYDRVIESFRSAACTVHVLDGTLSADDVAAQVVRAVEALWRS